MTKLSAGRAATRRLWLAALSASWALFATVGDARAGMIDASSPLSGPGGSSPTAWSPSTVTPNNEDATGGLNFNVLSHPGVLFTSTDFIDATLTTSISGGISEYDVFSQLIRNDTPDVWAGFVFSLPTSSSGDLLSFDTPIDGGTLTPPDGGSGDFGERTPAPFFTNTTTGLTTGASLHEEDLLFFEMLVLPGETTRARFALDVPDGVFAFSLRMAPVIPEPGVEVLLAAGALLLAWLMRADGARQRRIALPGVHGSSLSE